MHLTRQLNTVSVAGDIASVIGLRGAEGLQQTPVVNTGGKAVVGRQWSLHVAAALR